MSKKIEKQEYHITDLPLSIDPNLSQALGEMVIAYARLEDMFKVAIKRIEGERTLEQVIKDFSDMDGTIGRLVNYCQKFSSLSGCCEEAKALNVARQDFVHATFAADDAGQYVRFRKLVGYSDLKKDIEEIISITGHVNRLIQDLDAVTGAILTEQNQSNIVARVSACGNI